MKKYFWAYTQTEIAKVLIFADFSGFLAD